MSGPHPPCSFLPWLRHGLATQVTSSSAQRPQLNVQLRLVGDGAGGGPLTRSLPQLVELYGPGDVQGIDSRAVIRVEPRDWTMNFEPNYLAAIEFYDEDFPWRYSPTPNDGAKLLPWLALVVLEEGTEFQESRPRAGQPLPVITLTALELLPPSADLWAWAHVQVNFRMASAVPGVISTDAKAVATEFEKLVTENPDIAHSRIVCPRKLKPNKSYHAFLIPAFETGRLTGLKLPTSTSKSATQSAWSNDNDRPQPLDFPVYFRWYFRTGAAGDFEQLVRLLKPKPPNEKVGVRDLSCAFPGADLPGFSEPVLKLGGALRVPRRKTDPDLDAWDEPSPNEFQVALAHFINSADDYAHPANPDQAVNDPVITAPLYGCWHALAQRLLHERNLSPITPTNNWLHELNLDPRYRVPAGYGTRVVQQNQEDFMRAAWEQVGEILEANRRIRLALLAREVAIRWHSNHLQPLLKVKSDCAFAMTGPVHRRVINEGRTVHFQAAISHLSTAASSAALRRILRPRGRLMKSIKFTDKFRPDNLLTSMGQGTATVVAPKGPNKGLLTVRELSKKFPVLAEECWDVSLPKCNNFTFKPLSNKDEFQCDNRPEAPGSDSARFKAARKEQCVLIRTAIESGREPTPIKIDVSKVAEVVVTAINPANTIPKRIGTTVHLPPHLGNTERFQEAMAYPRIDKPMYEPLKDISSDLFLPNFQLIEQNSITLLETNQKFIEAYMVGLNHEFARELLWREYPTDQRGSYFRQFWSVESFLGFNDLSPDARREKLYDIPPLHRWSRFEELGEHDHRDPHPGDKKQEVVLVIRGELLKRYPNTVIYAQLARWQEKPNGDIDISLPRELDDLSELSDTELRNLPRDKVRTPLYEAKVAPDVTFLGFDLTEEEARGAPVSSPSKEKPGWFFVLKERPGEPRFGLDTDNTASPKTVNDLSWSSTSPPIEDGQYLPAGGLATISLTAPPNTDEERFAQFNEDNEALAQTPSSARWAYLLLQAPVMMAVHATEMLPK